MLSFLLIIGFHVLRWAFIAAAVLTFIEVGVGGDALYSIVNIIKEVLLAIDWRSVVESLFGAFGDLFNDVQENLTNEAKACVTGENCQELLKPKS